MGFPLAESPPTPQPELPLPGRGSPDSGPQGFFPEPSFFMALTDPPGSCGLLQRG